MSELNKEELARHFMALREGIRCDVQQSIDASVQNHIRAIVDAEMDSRLQPITDAIGEVNDKKDGGTGLAGELARQGAKIDQLFTLRNIGTGVALCLSFTGAMLIVGMKSYIKGWLNLEPK